jgi:hypothetical protein
MNSLPGNTKPQPQRYLPISIVAAANPIHEKLRPKSHIRKTFPLAFFLFGKSLKALVDSSTAQYNAAQYIY